MSGQSQGALSKLAIDGEQMEFLKVSDGEVIHLVDSGAQAITGSLDRDEDRVSQGLKVIKLKIEMEMTPLYLDTILPHIGFTVSTSVYTPTDDFSSLEFDVIVDRVAKVHTYTDCKVDKAVFSGQRGSRPVKLTLTLLAKTKTEANAGTFSANSTDPGAPYVFHEGTFTALSSAREFDRFVLSINNNMFASFNNSQTASSICPTDREVSFAVSTPYTSSETDLLTDAGTDATGGAGILKFNRSTAPSTQFDLGNIKSIPMDPDVDGRTEIRLAQNYRVYATDSTPSIKITHASS